ncbi:MAG: putative manganese-dependent inorganic diphosphatase [Chloroflexi bacterium]|nr:putative manganese-dependent inorganic diphosphatase [Chloroflexota bacterium]
MPAPVYVIGHKNPDSDSICSAVGYATLLQLEGNRHAVPARQGVLRRETAFILQRFGVPSPALVTDVRPRVADVMTAPATCVHMDDSLYEAGQLLQSRGIRVLPVVDDECRLQGVLGVEDFARTFLADLDANHLDHVPLDLGNVVRILSGTVLVDVPGRVLSDRVMVGAMQVDSMVKQIEPDILLVMGDREDAQRAAIDVGVGALVVTGAHPVNDAIIELARERKVTVISVPHHTYATVRLIHLSAAVKHIMRTEVPTCGPDDLVDDVRDILRSGKARSLVVIDHERRVVGIVSRSNLLHPVRRQLFLVDHNERGQAVAGIEQAEVLGVIDHHRVADFQTNYPPFMRLEPLGSTSTIVAKLFAESGIAMPEAIAGVLLSGILADTLLFRGPTTTPEDRRVATVLAGRAGVDMHELGTCILVLASDVSDRSAAQLLTSDFKDLSTDGSQFGIGVFETTNDSDVLARREELLLEMARLRERGYTSVMFAIIDIMRERTTLLVQGNEEAVADALGAELVDGHTIHIKGILSRKKQLVPQLGAITRRIEGG